MNRKKQIGNSSYFKKKIRSCIYLLLIKDVIYGRRGTNKLKSITKKRKAEFIHTDSIITT